MGSYDYEESRKKRIEENKKRMEQLNLHTLSHSLLNNSSAKPSPPAKKVRMRSQELSLIPVRRSSRTADKPPPNYKEHAMEPLVGGRRVYKRKDLLNRVNASSAERIYSIERAQKVESTLGFQFPTFVKPMLQSHVSGGFWLSLPYGFCQAHLPHQDEMVTLVDEDEGRWETRYLVSKNGLSGGWRGFAIDHELADGDALVFQLLSSTTFKVYIIRVKSPEEEEEEDEDEALALNQDTAKIEASRGKKGTRRRK